MYLFITTNLKSIFGSQQKCSQPKTPYWAVFLYFLILFSSSIKLVKDTLTLSCETFCTWLNRSGKMWSDWTFDDNDDDVLVDLTIGQSFSLRWSWVTQVFVPGGTTSQSHSVCTGGRSLPVMLEGRSSLASIWVFLRFAANLTWPDMMFRCTWQRACLIRVTCLMITVHDPSDIRKTLVNPQTASVRSSCLVEVKLDPWQVPAEDDEGI